MRNIGQSLANISERIRDAELEYGREPGSIALLAVSKGHPAERVLEAIRAGHLAFGESYVQEALTKMARVREPDVEWHFIGPLQTNKSRAVAERFDWVHSVDRLKLAQHLSTRRPLRLSPLNVCVQVNVSGEPTKSGVAPGETVALCEAVSALPGIRLRGLMAIPAPCQGLDAQRMAFRPLRQLFEELRSSNAAIDTLSAGMSDDLEAAIAEGSTMVRIGTGIFGPRPTRS